MQIQQLEFYLDDSILTQRILRLRVGGEDVADFIDKVARKWAQIAPVAGFRKGRAPLAQVRAQYWQRLAPQAFEELKSAALKQVFEQLDDKDKPFLTPQVLLDPRVLTDAGPAPLYSTERGAWLAFPGSGASPEEKKLHPSRRLSYGETFEFAVKYLVDPSGIAKNPEQPVAPGRPEVAQPMQANAALGMGIPPGPALPTIPGLPNMPGLPQAPFMPRQAETSESPE